jgi:hypothetical protein
MTNIRGSYKVKRTAIDRFSALVNKTEECWLWTGHTSKDGYGYFQEASRTPVTAHRFSYKAFVGDIPAGLEIDHTCRVRHCVNPEHLEVVTHDENMRRARRVECRRGHPYTGNNFFVNKAGDRVCKICTEMMRKARVERKKA